MSETHARGSWTVLDTHFGTGDRLFHTLRERSKRRTTELLHYVGICASPPRVPFPIDFQIAGDPICETLAQAFAAVTPGFQRIVLANGLVRVTLCIGTLHAMLAEQSFLADEIHTQAEPDAWDKWIAQLIARRCRRGTVLHIYEQSAAAASAEDCMGQLATLGFQWQSPTVATYNPSWVLRTTRTRLPPPCTHVARCAVVGAGLAGAAVAHSMAQRGWQVTVVDSHNHSAGGASGLPIGLVVPHVSVDDNARSRLSRIGVSLMLQHAARLLRRGEDWDASGVLETGKASALQGQASRYLQVAAWMSPGLVQHSSDPWGLGVEWNNSLWHRRAAWIKPAKLVQAWLSEAGIQWRGGTRIGRIEHHSGVWSLYDPDSRTVAQAEIVILANAGGAAELLRGMGVPLADTFLQQLAMVQALHGTVSHGRVSDADRVWLPPFPVNGGGSIVTAPDGDAESWYTGATYEHQADALEDLPRQHRYNLDRLQRLLPGAGKALADTFHTDEVHAWTGTRCVSNDRLPWAGPVETQGLPGLWISAAMGSRGLSFAALCAELVAAQLGGEPLPIETRLARCLSPQRAAHGKFAAAQSEPNRPQTF